MAVVGSQTIQLHRGENPFTLSYTAVSAGWHSFRAHVVLAGDERAENDVLTGSVKIGAPPRVIVASAVPHPPIAAILASRGLRATVALPASLPRGAAGYAAVDAVVLDDVPANLLSASQIGALAAAVQDGGLGLLTLGGRHAYSLGDMRTPRSTACSRLRASVPAICSAATSRSSSCWIAPAAWPTPPGARAFPR